MALDRGTIDQQLQALGEGSRWWNARELRDLPIILEADEQILAISRGKVARVRWLRRAWLIVVTDRRLLCVRSANASGWRQVEVNAAHIDRVALRVGPFRGRVLVGAGGSTLRLLVPRPDAYRLSAALQSVGGERQSFSGFAPGRVVRRVFDHVLSLPAAAFSPDAPAPAPIAPRPADPLLEQRVHFLEEQLQELQKQVDFLEQLLRERQGALAPGEDFRP